MSNPLNGQPAPSVEEIDSLRNAAQSNDPIAGKNLWQALFRIPKWHLIDKAPEGQTGQPHGGVADNKGFLFVFTDANRASVFLDQHRLKANDAEGKPSETPARILTVDPEEVIRMAHTFVRQGLFGVQFNPGPLGFAAPLAVLIPVWSECKGVDPVMAAKQFGVDEFDVLATRANQLRSEPELKKVLRHAWRQEAWIMLDNPQQPGKPLIATLQDGQQALMLFTSEVHAGRAAFAGKVNKPDGSVDLIKIAIPTAINEMRNLAGQGMQLAVFNIASAGFALRFDLLDWLAEGKD